jgi:multicomponent Na+:H+ antiporter subunit E
VSRRQRIVVLKRFILMAGLWLVLTSGDAGGWFVGAPACVAAALISARLLPPARTGLSIGGLLSLLLDFARGSVAGGFDVARRALDPRLPVRPGWIRHPLHLPPGAPRMVLGDILSLMPGTLAAGEASRELLVHCLDSGQPVARDIELRERLLQRALRQTGEDTNG